MVTLSTEEFNAKLNAARQASIETEEEKPITLNEALMQSAVSNEIDWRTQLKGLGIEGVGSVGGTAATLKGLKSYKTLQMLRKVRRVGQTAALAGAAGPQIAEPTSTVVGVGTVLITEGVWSLGSNYLKQEFFKAKGIQEETSGGELLTSVLLLSPIIHQGRAIPKLGRVFDTSMIKSRTWKVGAHTVQGATIGAVESSIRQTFDLIAAEEKDLSEFSFTDLATGIVGGAGIGGGLSTAGETYSGIKLLNIYRKVIQRSKIDMTGALNEKLARLEKTIESARKMRNGRRLSVARKAYAETKQKRDIFYAIHDELEDNLDSLEDVTTPKLKPEPQEAPEATPKAKTPESAPFRGWQEQEAYSKKIGGLGLERNPSVDSTLTSLTGDALETTKVKNNKELEVLEDKVLGNDSYGKTATRKDVDDLAALHDKSSAIENEEFRRQIELNIKEHRAAQTDAERQETLDFLLDDVFNKLGKSKEDDFKVAYFIDQIEKEGLFDEFAKAHKRAIGERIKRDPDYAYAYEEVFNEELLEKFKRGKKVLDDIKSSPKTSKENTTASNMRGDTIEGPTLNTPAPKTPEVAPEAQSPMQSVYDSYEKLINNMDEGRGGYLTAELNEVFNRAADDFNQRAEAFIKDPNDDTIASLEEVLDEFIILDKYDARLKQSQGQGLGGQAKNAKDKNFTGDLSLPRKTRQEGLKGVREKLKLMRDDGDFSRFDELLEKVLETPETPVVTPKGGEAPSPKPKDTSEVENDSLGTTEEITRTREKLEKQLEKLQQRFGDDEANITPKQKKKKEDENQDLKDRISFYKKAEKEALNRDKAEKELKRLTKIIERADPKELEFEGFTKQDLLKGGKAQKKVEGLREKLLQQNFGIASFNMLKKGISETKKQIRDTARPPKSAKERSIERLQKKLDDLRAVRSGEQDPKAPKPKKPKSAEEKDLEERIKFYKGESKEVAEIAKTEERIALFLKLLRGGDVKAMQQELGLPPAMRPEFTKKKNPESYLNDLKEIESGLKKDIRKRQTQEILSDINKVTNPSDGTASPVDSLLDGLISARTASLLNQPTTSTTGLPSGALAYFWRLGRNSLNDAFKLSGIPGLADSRLKGKRFKQKSVLATSEMVATASQIFDVSPKALIAVGRNMKETFLNLGNSAYFYKDGNKFVEQEGQVGNAPMKAQAAAKAKREELRLRAIQTENMLERVLLNAGSSKPFEYITQMYLIGRTVLGTLDEPFLMAMNDRGNRAEAIRQSILTNAADPEKFIQEYMSNVSKFEGGATRFNYFDEQYKNVANQTRRDLFRKADLDRKDIRRNPSETVADGINRLFAGSVVGKLLGGLFSPFVSTPVIGLGQNVSNFMSSFGVQPTIRLTQEISDKVNRLVFPHRQSSALFGKYNKALQSARLEAKKLQEEIDDKKAKREDVKSEEVALGIKNEEIEQLTRYKEDEARDELGRSIIALSIGMFSYYATKEGLMLGSGAGLEDEQRRESNFQKRKNRIFTDDTKSVGFSYMLFEQFRATMSFWSDLATYDMLAESGALTENQKGVEGFINFLTNTIEATATDAPFTTGLRQFSDIAIGNTEEKMQTAVSIGSSSLGVPSGIRSANRFGNDVYYDYSRGLTMENLFGRIGSAALGLPTQNVRTNQLGRPVSPNQKNPWNYVFRYAPERLKPENALERDAMIEDLLLNDATSFGLISKKPTSLYIDKVTVPMKKFVNQEGEDLMSLYERTLNEDDAMIDEIWEEMQTSSWESAYDNYTVDSKDGRPFNKGIERINEIIKKYRNKTKKKLSDETGPLQYYYYKGQNVFEYIQAQKILPQTTGDSKGILF